MAWPTPQDYQEAMQNPSIAFADPELLAGKAELDQLGLPRPISGAFACVYKVKGPTRIWAVRCFLKKFEDQQQRYAAITASLARVSLPFIVRFEFLKQGIRVRGDWYPALKMEWVQGENIGRYVTNNLQSSQTLLSLGLAIVQMARALHDAGIAHGDFQHGNILVVNGKPMLIDYDGMYVPALKGLGSHEVGHPNYQHPARNEHDFGPGLDNFSVWVIYLSLLALSVRPDLWKQFQGGDDCLLFRRKDFDKPDRSPVLLELERLPDARVQTFVEMFRSLIHLGPLQVPLIDLRPPAKAGHAGPQLGGDWLKDHVLYREAEPPAVNVAPTLIDASWILDNWSEQDQKLSISSFENSVLLDRLVLLGSVLLLTALLTIVLLLLALQIRTVFDWGIMALFSLLLLLCNFGYWKYRYATEGCVVRVRTLKRQVQDLQREIEKKQRITTAAERGSEAELERMAEIERQTRTQLDSISEHEQQLIGEALRQASRRVDEVRQLRASNHANEEQELRSHQRDVAKAVADLDRQIAALTQAEGNDRDIALNRRKEQHLQQRLQSALLSNATINGIGSKYRDSLYLSGFRTAADINQRIFSVRHIGSRRGTDLLGWRRSVEQQARAAEPTALPLEEGAALRARYEQQRLPLQALRVLELQRVQDSEPGIRGKYSHESQNLARREAVIQARLPQEVQQIRDHQFNQRAQLEGNLTSLADERKNSRLLSDLACKIARSRQQLAQLNWKRDRLTKRVNGMGTRFTFHNYVRRLF